MSAFPLPAAITLLRADFKNIARDPLLAGGAALAISPAVLLSLFGAPIDEAGLDFLGLPRLSLALAGPAILMGPAIMGWIFGFLLLEDRDDTVLLALEVTPLGKSGFIAYRLATTLALSTILALIAAVLALPDSSLALVLGTSLIAGLHGVAVTLFLVGFAANKVEGLALTKLINISLVAPLLALAPPWRFAGSPIGPFWLGEMLGLRADAMHFPLAVGSGLFVTLALIAMLYRRMRRRLG